MSTPPQLPNGNTNAFNSPTFRAELTEVLDEKLAPITKLLEKHDRSIEKHEAALNRARGAKWAFGVGWIVLTALWEWLMHGTGPHKP